MSGASVPGSPREADAVLTLADIDQAALVRLLTAYGLELILLPAQSTIPGSFWGEREAGLQGPRLYARHDTPVHSVLHEGSHYVCMDPRRRASLDRDAGGDELEECAVCYLQVLLARTLAGVGAERLMQDMDAWGYSFRLGSTQAWFEADASDASAWLQRHGIVDGGGRLTGAARA